MLDIKIISAEFSIQSFFCHNSRSKDFIVIFLDLNIFIVIV